MIKLYPCGCSANGGDDLPDYCPDHTMIPQTGAPATSQPTQHTCKCTYHYCLACSTTETHDLCPLHAQAGALREALQGLNWMSNYEVDGFCCCPRGDGHIPDREHATSCANARRALLAATKGA